MRNLILNGLLRQSFNLFTGFLLSTFIFAGCGQKVETKKFTVTEGHKRFEDKCLKDFNLHVRTQQVGQTLYIYLPIKDPIFDYEVQKEKPPSPTKDTPKFVINFTDGKFQNNIFSFEYDILDKKKTKDEDYGFNSSYTDSYVKNQNNIFTAIYEVFLNTKATKNEIDPLFFVVIITDIKKGIETRATFYLTDFMRYMSGDIPNDEYMKRFLSDRKGSSAMIGNETGSHVKYVEITMGDFLAKQIVNRIQFKFQYSDFPPVVTIIKDAFSRLGFDNDDLFKNLIKYGYIDRKGIVEDKFRELTEYSQMNLDSSYNSQKKEIFSILDNAVKRSYDDTVVSIAADTLRYYHFENFTNVRLNNLRAGKKYIFDNSQLVNFGDDKPKENEGRLIHIRFKDGKAEFNEEETSQKNQQP